jgi:hypothetical protein
MLGVTSTPLSAAATRPVNANELVSAFTDICLKSLGDEQAQIAAAQGKPWRFVAQQAADDEKRFRSDAFALGIRTANENCALTAELEKSASLGDVKAAFMKVAGADEPKPLPQSDSVYWIIAAQPDNREYVIGLKVSGASGRNLATIAVSKRKSSK